ncbi:MAG: hypothetical protein K8T89_02180 [Planctomycetes bacterium]|nr:hypothetical protein [Planctomycetota bacterium]
MMRTMRIALLAAFVSGGLYLAVNSFAAEPAKDADEKTAKRAEAINDLAVASQLIAFGKGQTEDLTGLKGFKSPEALVAAAGILLRIDASIGGKFDPLEDNAKNDKDVEETLSLKEEANTLIGDARKMVKGSADKEKALEALITQAKTFESRGAVGRPRMQTRNLNPGGNWTFNINFVPRQQAAVTFRSTGTSRLHFEIIGERGGHILNFFGTWANYAWMPAGDKNDGKKNITIRVTNVGKNPATFTMATN